MRYHLGSFKSEDKPVRDLFRPGPKHTLFGHAIKSIVDLYRVETSRIEVEHLFGRDLFRIESPFPFLVRISACADMDFHNFSLPPPLTRVLVKLFSFGIFGQQTFKIKIEP